MTLGTVGFGRSFPRIWIIPIGIFIVVFGLAVAGVLSRAIVADFLAWWPLWLVTIGAAVFFRHRSFGRLRASGLVPLAATLLVLVFIWGHLAGWQVMPSSTQRLVGPVSDGVARASLVVDIDGVVEVSAQSQDLLYVVEPTLGGGQFGIPEATERREDDSVGIELNEIADPGLYTYSGWEIHLAPGPLWTLDLNGAVDADLSGLALAEVDLAGAGTLTVGRPTAEVTIAVLGDYDITIPSGAPASVTGVATVPDTWTLTDTGAEAPGGSVGGWKIVAVGDGQVSVREG